MKLTTIFAASSFALSAIACAQSADLRYEAAQAIERGDIAALDAMRFRAYDVSSAPIPNDALLSTLAGCSAIGRSVSGDGRGSIHLRYDCSKLDGQRRNCESDILIVSVDRATSPDAFAHMWFEQKDTPECRRPIAPAPPG